MTTPISEPNVETLPPSDSWSPEQALAAAGQAGLRRTLIMGIDGDGKDVLLFSKMTREEMLWLSEKARRHALYG